MLKDKKMAMPLKKSYKGKYPFKIGTTSFIYRDAYVPNVKMLGPYVDAIELLLFESKTDSLPTKNEISELVNLSREFDLTFNIHLPTDIFVGDRNSSVRQHAVETIQGVLDLTSPLSPFTCTLHVSYDDASRKNANINKWQEVTYQTLKQLVNCGIQAETISIENLNYPFEWVEDIVKAFNFSICMDIGHLILCGRDIKTFFHCYSDQISIIHLHGVKNGSDHLSLESLSKERIKEIMEVLTRFSKVVSLEVFSYPDLLSSLEFLEKCWKKVSHSIKLA
jgi:sugar phosphate isomerase/epimerase